MKKVAYRWHGAAASSKTGGNHSITSPFRCIIIERGFKPRRSETIYEIAGIACCMMALMVKQGLSLEDIHRKLASCHVIDHTVKQEKMIT